MAEITKQALKVDNNQSFPNNNNGAITPSILRAFNTNMIDSMVDEISYNVDSASWNAQFANLGGITGSFATTGSNTFTGANNFTSISASSFVSGTFFVGDGSKLTNIPGGVPLTSLNTFTGSQNTKNTTLATYTASVDTKFTAVGASTSSLNTFTGSQNTKNTTLATYTGSNDTKWNTLGTQTGSFVTETESGSFLITASVSLNTITFTKGNNTTFAITVNTGSGGGGSTDISSLNAFTASQDTKNATLATYTASVDISLSNINSFTASQQTKDTTLASVTSSLNTATASLFTSASLALVTASAAGSTITFTKGDSTIFNVTLDTGSATSPTTIFEVVYTGENITKGDPLYISGSQGANPIVFIADAADPNKMPVTFVSNETIGVNNTTNAIVLGLIEGINLTGYTAGQAIYVAEGGGWSANLPSGSNSVTQLLGVVTKAGSGGKGLVLNPGPAQLPGLDTGKMWVGGSTNQPVEITTASFASSASFNSYTSSTNSRLTNIEATTASLNTSVAALNTFTQSQDTKNTTLGNLTGSFATTGSNSFNGIQSISGSFNLTGSAFGNVVSMSITSNTASMNFNLGNYFELTASVSHVRIEVSNLKGGVTSTLALNGVTASTINFSSNVLQPSGSAYTASVSGSNDILSFVAFNSNRVNVVSTLKMI